SRGASPRSGAVLKSGKVVISLHSQLVEEGGQGGDGVDAEPEVTVGTLGRVRGEPLLASSQIDGVDPSIAQLAVRVGPLCGLMRVDAAQSGYVIVLDLRLVDIGSGEQCDPTLDASGGDEVGRGGDPPGGLGLGPEPGDEHSRTGAGGLEVGVGAITQLFE